VTDPSTGKKKATKKLAKSDPPATKKTAKAVLTDDTGKNFADVSGPSDDADKGWVNEAQTWKNNNLYIDFWRSTVFTNSLKANHIPKLDVKTKYDYTLSYGIYENSYADAPKAGTTLTMAMGTLVAPSKLTVLAGAMWNAGVTAATAAGLVAVTLY